MLRRAVHRAVCSLHFSRILSSQNVSLAFDKNFLQSYPRGIPEDLGHFASGIDLGSVLNLIQNVIDNICKWCSSADLSVDQKAGLMLITSRKKYKLRNIYLKGKVQSYQDNIKYLGITIDNKMNWAEHCKVKARKALTSLLQCKRAIGTK